MQCSAPEKDFPDPVGPGSICARKSPGQQSGILKTNNFSLQIINTDKPLQEAEPDITVRGDILHTLKRRKVRKVNVCARL